MVRFKRDEIVVGATLRPNPKTDYPVGFLHKKWAFLLCVPADLLLFSRPLIKFDTLDLVSLLGLAADISTEALALCLAMSFICARSALIW